MLRNQVYRHSAKLLKVRQARFCFCMVLLLGASSMVRAQPSKRADAYFEAQQYHVAARLYQEVLEKDTTHYYAAFQLARSYDGLFQYEEAERYYAYVARYASDNFPEALFYYAQSLQKNQACSRAIAWYERYLALPETKRALALSEQAQREKEGCLQAMLETTEKASVTRLKRLPGPVNSTYQEFAPLIFKADSLMAFSSSRLQKNSLRSHRSGEGFTDQYLVRKDTSGWQLLPQGFGKLNTTASEASGSFTADRQHYYFTRCSEKGGGCQIYVARYNGNRWYAARPLGKHINLPGTNSKHPCISPSGDTLFFVSDRRGGEGNTDVWMSLKSGQQAWQAPRNLGPRVNTSRDEVFPYYHSEEQLLIFASDGREGRGGMDLYLLGLKDETAQAIPLHEPFNSSKDDCCFVFGRDKGYLSSNREGSFDIYVFEKQPRQTVRQLALGISPGPVARTAHARAYDGIITDHSLILDHEPEYLGVMQSGTQEFLSNGSSRFVLSADVNDILLEQLRDERALSDSSTLQPEDNPADTLSSENVLAVFTTRQGANSDQFEVRGTIRNAVTYQPIPAMRLYLLDRAGNVIKITTTNEQGAFRFVNLSNASQYKIVDADAMQEEFVIEYDIARYGDEIQTLKFENIYFDFNQATLRNEAKVALDELAALYRKHPNAVLEINAFTDTTGNDVYNLQLSRERGLAAFNYLLASGVDRSSLVINARGASTAVSSSNSYVSQQLNRRVEFYITGREIQYESNIVTRMLRPKVTLYTLSSNTGMPIEDIKRLNGLTANTIQAYKPVRLYDWAAERAPGLFYQMTVRSEE